MARIELKNLAKSFTGPDGQKVPVVKQLDLTIEHREFFVLVGPSGSGKTTTLRLVAGLEIPDTGTITMDGQVVNRLPPRERDIAMVFQNYALYPHLRVAENLGFPLILRNLPAREIRQRVEEIAERFGLSAFLEHYPRQLSGGQRQRVALGRALIRRPKIFLMDEPLTHLDAPQRLQMRQEIRQLHRQMETTTIYVTHEQTEAMSLGDRIAVMHQGVLLQVADAQTFHRRPVNRFVAGFMGNPLMNFIAGVFSCENGSVHFREFIDDCANTAILFSLPLPLPDEIKDLLNQPVVIGLRPEHLTICPPSQIRDPSIPARLVWQEDLGCDVWRHFRTIAHPLTVRGTNEFQPATGGMCALNFRFSQAHFFAHPSGERLP